MATGNGKPLRFAALIRVSTEKQAAQGESLRTQSTQIDAAVASLGGKVVARYAGQEHATADWERKQLDKLLTEAKNPRRTFDAVIVADPSRWSRDNVASETGLTILRDSGVKFYVLTTAYDLFDPQSRLYLALNSTIGAFHAATQKKKSLENRIERAKRGIPTAGKLPFGRVRVWDGEKECWSVDPEKQKMIVDVAERYLAGESLPKLAREYRQNHSNLCKVLRERCGDQWTEEFRADDLNIADKATHTIPRLLPEKTIRAIRQRLEANRTYVRKGGRTKNTYRLSGRVFCAECGYAMCGQKNRNGHLYYRHAHRDRDRVCPLKEPRPWVRADLLEEKIVGELFDTFGNPAAIELAVKAAIPDCDRLLKQRERIATELAKIGRARDAVLDRIERELITDEQADKKLLDLKQREAQHRVELDKVTATLADIPDADVARRAALQVFEQDGTIVVEDDFGNTYEGGNDVQSFLMMDDADIDKLIAAAFDGALPDGKPAGVYVSPVGGDFYGPKQFAYTIRGRLVTGNGRVMSRASRSLGTPQNALLFQVQGTLNRKERHATEQ